MKITVKRATTDGIKESEGVLFEEHGYQFCLIHDREDGFFRAIELYSGCSVKSLATCFYTKKSAFDMLKSIIIIKAPEDFKKAINRAKRIYGKEYGFKFPINEPVKPAL